MTDPRRPHPVVLDMTPEGTFVDPPTSGAAPIDRAVGKVGRIAMAVAGVGLALTLGALALAALTVLIPVVLVAGAIAFGAMWWRVRRMRQQGHQGPVFVVMRR
ncbi:hypothetical protein ACQW02_07525 [Humitalea sp. 24SJ18S-53]|uniref:hypothetical protein n=1 Tax=Humitalea sp. 24SJ18S-53 TaxID=3422307 RepID=UPI003D67EAF3